MSWGSHRRSRRRPVNLEEETRCGKIRKNKPRDMGEPDSAGTQGARYLLRCIRRKRVCWELPHANGGIIQRRLITGREPASTCRQEEPGQMRKTIRTVRKHPSLHGDMKARNRRARCVLEGDPPTDSSQKAEPRGGRRAAWRHDARGGILTAA